MAFLLLADGNQTRRQNLASGLRVNRVEVDLATGGFHVISMVEQEDFSALVINGNMFDMPWREIVGLVRDIKTKEELPIILGVKNIPQDEILEAFQLGVNDFVKEPESIAQLLEKTKKYSGKKPSEAEETKKE
jgi:PleD family two-component response regulator